MNIKEFKNISELLKQLINHYKELLNNRQQFAKFIAEKKESLKKFQK